MSDSEAGMHASTNSSLTNGGEAGPPMDDESTLTLSTASTHLMDNRETTHAHSRAAGLLSTMPLPTSPASASVSKNSLAASRLLRNRKDRGHRAKAAQQLMEHLVPARTSSVTLSDATTERTTADPIAPGSPSLLRNRLKSRHRGTGGAYAKLMVQGPTSPKTTPIKDLKHELEEPPSSPPAVESEESDPADDGKVIVTAQELDGLRKMTVTEFSTGPESNLRYHMHLDELVEEDDDVDVERCSDTSTPSILNRSEIFHENAAAAVVALLTPKQRGDHTSVFSSASTLDDAGLRVTPSERGLMITAEPTSYSAFRGPHATLMSDGPSATSFQSRSGLDMSYDGAVPRSPITEPILSSNAEKVLESVKAKMIDPNKTLSELLTAIATPEGDEPMDRAFMVRRKNACGALKVLTATPANRRTICWTVGVLPALTSVLEDTGDESLLVAFPDHRTRTEYIEARKRAVASLVNLAILKENRIPIFHTPGLVQSVCAVIVDDVEESRQGCCALLGYLCKTQDNRLLMAQVPGLLNALSGVVAPIIPKEPPVQHIRKKKKYHWEDSDDEMSSADQDSFSTDARDTSMCTEGSDRLTSSYRTDDDSDITPQASPSPRSPVTAEKIGELYDSDSNQFLHGARKNVFAVLLHLVKEKDNIYALARHEKLMQTMVDIALLHNSPSHVHAVKVLANVTRHRANSKHIVFKVKIIVPAMVEATKSPNDEARIYSLYALQNLSQDRYCRQEVANTKDLITALCQRARQARIPDEKFVAIAALKNLTDDPANLIPMSNTPECFATLMQIAHGTDVDEKMQYLACDALATLSHWLRKIATSGSVGQSGNDAPASLFVPTLKVVTFDQWT